MIFTFTQSFTSQDWHLRPLTSRGRSPIRGIDTESVCGAVKEGLGIDREDPLTERNLKYACVRCVSGAEIVPEQPAALSKSKSTAPKWFDMAMQLLAKYDAASKDRSDPDLDWLWTATLREARKLEIPHDTLVRAVLIRYGEVR